MVFPSYIISYLIIRPLSIFQPDRLPWTRWSWCELRLPASGWIFTIYIDWCHNWRTLQFRNVKMTVLILWPSPPAGRWSERWAPHDDSTDNALPAPCLTCPRTPPRDTWHVSRHISSLISCPPSAHILLQSIGPAVHIIWGLASLTVSNQQSYHCRCHTSYI